MGKLLTRDQILRAPDIQEETVAVPEWGGNVLVRGMTGAERDAFEASVITGRGANRQVNLQNIRAKLVARSVVDEAGAQIFTEADIEALGGKSALALERLFDVASRLSGIGAVELEELAKN